VGVWHTQVECRSVGVPRGLGLPVGCAGGGLCRLWWVCAGWWVCAAWCVAGGGVSRSVCGPVGWCVGRSVGVWGPSVGVWGPSVGVWIRSVGVWARSVGGPVRGLSPRIREAVDPAIPSEIDQAFALSQPMSGRSCPGLAQPIEHAIDAALRCRILAEA
jgi:hypothetical protein